MSHAVKSLWLLTLVAFIAGCSGYRGLPGPNLPGEGVEGPTWPEELEIRDQVKVTLKDGRKIEGLVSSLRVDAIVLVPQSDWRDQKPDSPYEDPGMDPVRRTGQGKLSIPADQVVQIKKHGADGGKTGLAILGVVVLAFGALAIAFAASGGMGDMGFD